MGGTDQAVSCTDVRSGPSADLTAPHLIVTANVLVADTAAEAEQPGASPASWVHGIRTGSASDWSIPTRPPAPVGRRGAARQPSSVPELPRPSSPLWRSARGPRADGVVGRPRHLGEGPEPGAAARGVPGVGESLQAGGVGPVGDTALEPSASTVRISAPSSVTTTVCSNWADGIPSSRISVQPSSAWVNRGARCAASARRSRTVRVAPPSRRGR